MVTSFKCAPLLNLLPALLAILLAAHSPARASGKPGAIVVSVTGEVSIKPDGAASFRPISAGDALYAGDSIKTGHGGRMSAVLKSGAEVRLNEDSLFVGTPSPGGPGAAEYRLRCRGWRRWP